MDIYIYIYKTCNEKRAVAHKSRSLLPFGLEKAVAFEPQDVGAVGRGRGSLRAQLLVLPEVAAKGRVGRFERRVVLGVLSGGGFGVLGLRCGVVFDGLLPPARCIGFRGLGV